MRPHSFWFWGFFVWTALVPGALSANRWTHFANTDAITTIADDGKHLWLGTAGGLIRVHKSAAETTYFNVANSGLTDASIRSLASDGAGRVAAVTHNGCLALYDGLTWTTLSGKSALLGQSAIDVAWGSGGSLWVIAADEKTRFPSLFRWQHAAWSRYYLDTDEILFRTAPYGFGYSPYSYLPQQRPWLQADAKGRIWATVMQRVLRHKVFRVDSSGAMDTMPVPYHLAPVQMVVSDTGNMIWITRSGLARLTDTGWDTTSIQRIQYDYAQSLSGHPRNLFVRQSDGSELWAIGFRNLYRLDSQGWDSLTRLSLAEREVPLLQPNRNALADNQGAGVWMAASNRFGLLQGDSWDAHETFRSPLRRDHGLSIAAHGPSRESILLAGVHGMEAFDPVSATFQTQDLPPEWGDPHGLSMATDRKGRLWMSGFPASRIFVLNGQGWLTAPNGWKGALMPNHGASSFMAEDDSGSLWFADSGRLLFSPNGSENPSTWIAHPMPDSWKTGSHVTAIAAHPDGSVWVVVESPNLPRLTLASYRPDSGWRRFDSLPMDVSRNQFARSMHVDKEGQVWVFGTQNVIMWNGTNWWTSNLTSEPFGDDLDIAAMTTDSEGTLWAATAPPYAGLYRWDEGWRQEKDADGKFSTTEIRTMAFDGKGKLWMTSYPSGVVVYDPTGAVSGLPTLRRVARQPAANWIRNGNGTWTLQSGRPGARNPASLRSLDLNGRTLPTPRTPHGVHDRSLP